MGVDFYNCHNCNEIYADCGRYGSCEGCEKSWCESCMDDIKSFDYNDEPRCDLCFLTNVKEIKTKDILSYALKQLNKTKRELEEEMEKLPEFSTPQNKYECKGVHSGECNPNCTNIAADFDFDGEEDKIIRGLCCRGRFQKDEISEYCKICSPKKIKIKE